MIKTYVIDTNVLIQAPYAVNCFEDNQIVLPVAVLEELDNLDIKIFRFEKHDEGYEELNEQEKAEEKTNILNALNFARKVIATQECDFLLLDEILALPDYGITTAEAIGDILKMKDESMHILLTGRTLPDSLRKYADSITTLTTEIV